MKNTQNVALLAIGLFWLAACSSEQQQDAAAETDSEVAQTSSADSPVDAYLALKDALVATDAEKAAKAAETLASVSTGEVKSNAEKIAQATDVEVQRSAFEDISHAMYEQVKADNSSGKTLYKQYCPMAFDDKGAYWLSSEEEIMNPYFGDKMLHCGKVQETLAAN